MKLRIEVLEVTVTQLRAQVKNMLPCVVPPGLHNFSASEQFQRRVERLETLLVCSPECSLDVDVVLARLLERRCSVEPEKEISLIKQLQEIQDQDLSGTVACLNFDKYRDADIPNLSENAFSNGAPGEFQGMALSSNVQDNGRDTVDEENDASNSCKEVGRDRDQTDHKAKDIAPLWFQAFEDRFSNHLHDMASGTDDVVQGCAQ